VNARRLNRPVVAIEPIVRIQNSATVLEMGTGYSDAVYRAGGIPLLLAAPLSGEASPSELLDNMDALIFTGGPDFHTERLGLGPKHAHARPGLAAKQDFDVTLLRHALERDLPVLGICYGMQLLGIVAGARLLQHLPDDRPGAQVRHLGRPGEPRTVRHDVIVKEETLVSKALGGAGRLQCLSAHHQGITELPGPGWQVSATDDDGLIEAIESTSHRFAVGVQWHPEREEELTPHDGLFTALLEAASDSEGRG
jgi:putative glutamine amidotransferase